MHNFETDAELVQAIKTNWTKYGRLVILGLVLIAAGILGFQKWTTHQHAQKRLVATQFDALLQQVAIQQPDEDAIHLLAKQIEKQHADSPYNSLAKLLVAKMAIEKHQFAQAKQLLQWVARHGPAGLVQDTAHIRLARLALQSKDPKAALAILKDDHLKKMYPAITNFLSAEAYYQLKEGDKAELLMKEAVRALPSETPARMHNWLLLESSK